MAQCTHIGCIAKLYMAGQQKNTGLLGVTRSLYVQLHSLFSVYTSVGLLAVVNAKAVLISLSCAHQPQLSNIQHLTKRLTPMPEYLVPNCWLLLVCASKRALIEYKESLSSIP